MSHPLERLFGLEHIGIKLGLDAIGRLSAALGHPERAYRTVIVAGTNGKGSVTAMVETALRAEGFRTGRYTSPHLARLEERFAIDGLDVDHDALVAAAVSVFDLVDRLVADGTLEVTPTFFEVTTAIGFELFRRAAVDISVLEVGMGGRFDATNVATPVAGAIVSIDVDHQRYLGDTLAKIAYEKAGICKPGVPVVCGERKREPLAVIAQVAESVGAPLVLAHEGTTTRVEEADGRVRLALATPACDYGTMTLGLRGLHQADNAIVAVRLLEVLGARGVTVGAAAIRAGIETVRWPARLEVIERRDGRRAILDAAHNPAGAASLAAYLERWHPGGVPIVFAAMRDKDVDAMIRTLAPAATAFVVTTAPSPRAMAAADLKAMLATLAPGVAVEAVADPVAAVRRAEALGDPVVVAGSIFLAGAVRPHLI